MPFAGFAVSQGTADAARASSSPASPATSSARGSPTPSGYYGGRPFVDRCGKYVLLRHHHLDTARALVRPGTGAPVVFFSRMLPIVRTFISLPAGFGKMPFWKFTLYTALGCIPWVLMLGWVGVKLGANWEKIRPLPALRRLRRGRGARRARRLRACCAGGRRRGAGAADPRRTGDEA